MALAAIAVLVLGVDAQAGSKGGLYDFSAMLNAPHPFAAAGAAAYSPPPAAVPVAPPAPTLRYVPQPGSPSGFATTRPSGPAGGAPAPTASQSGAQAASSSAQYASYASDDEGSSGWFDRLYLSFGGGFDSADDIGGRTNNGTQFETELEAGYYLAMALGRSFGHNLRAELELSYRSEDYGTTRSGAASVSGSGLQTTTALMVNGFYDVRFGWPIVPFVGAGIGAAFIDGDDVAVGGSVAPGRDATEFAYQGIIGLSYDIGERWHVVLDGRYFGTGDDDVSSLGAGLNLRIDL